MNDKEKRDNYLRMAAELKPGVQEGLRQSYLRMAEELDDRVALVEKLGDDVWDDGVVLTFDTTFIEGRNPDRHYVFVAFKAGGGWYIAASNGVNAGRRTWEGLLSFMLDRKTVHEVWRASQYEQVL